MLLQQHSGCGSSSGGCALLAVLCWVGCVCAAAVPHLCLFAPKQRDITAGDTDAGLSVAGPGCLCLLRTLSSLWCELWVVNLSCTACGHHITLKCCVVCARRRALACTCCSPFTVLRGWLWPLHAPPVASIYLEVLCCVVCARRRDRPVLEACVAALRGLCAACCLTIWDMQPVAHMGLCSAVLCSLQ